MVFGLSRITDVFNGTARAIPGVNATSITDVGICVENLRSNATAGTTLAGSTVANCVEHGCTMVHNLVYQVDVLDYRPRTCVCGVCTWVWPMLQDPGRNWCAREWGENWNLTNMCRQGCGLQSMAAR